MVIAYGLGGVGAQFGADCDESIDKTMAEEVIFDLLWSAAAFAAGKKGQMGGVQVRGLRTVGTDP